MMFVDGSNLLHTSQVFRPGFKIDYVKLRDVLLEGRNLVRPYFYCSRRVPDDPTELGFREKLQYLGFSVSASPLRRRGTGWVEKGVDAALVTDMLCMAFRNVYDIAIVVSGDIDLKGAIEVVKTLGKRVEIAAFKCGIGRDMKLIADKFIPLDDIADKIAL